MAIVEDSTVDLLSGCTKLLSAPRYEQVRVVKQWLSPILIKHFSGYALICHSKPQLTSQL